jgi:hypothetical protein
MDFNTSFLFYITKMYTTEYLRNLKVNNDNERKTDPLKFLIKRYTNSILNMATQGGKKYDITDIHESQIDIVIEKLREIFIDVNIEINEYHHPVMPLPQKSILITW